MASFLLCREGASTADEFVGQVAVDADPFAVQNRPRSGAAWPICYLALTYFASSLERKALSALAERLILNGFPVLGSPELITDMRFAFATGMQHVFTKVD